MGEAGIPVIPGNYRVLKEISSCRNRVFLCEHNLFGEDEKSRKKFAIKEQKGVFSSDNEVDRCRLFTKLCHLVHPNLVRMHRVECDAENNAYLVMDYVKGETADLLIHDVRHLERCIRDNFVAGLDQKKLMILRDVAASLDYIHRCGVLHLDVKPANVIVADDGHAKLIDFDLAANIADGEVRSHCRKCGTPHYMAPEIWNGEPLSPATDQWSLAVFAYELIGGGWPYWVGNDRARYWSEDLPLYRSWNSHDVSNVLGPHQSATRTWVEGDGRIPRSISSSIATIDEHPENQYLQDIARVILRGDECRLDSVSQQTNRVINKALSRSPGDRYGNCTEFVRALEEAERLKAESGNPDDPIALAQHNIPSNGHAADNSESKFSEEEIPDPQDIPPKPTPKPNGLAFNWAVILKWGVFVAFSSWVYFISTLVSALACLLWMIGLDVLTRSMRYKSLPRRGRLCVFALYVGLGGGAAICAGVLCNQFIASIQTRQQPIKTSVSLYDSAQRDFAAGNYESAIRKVVTLRDDKTIVSEEEKSKAAHLAVLCHVKLGNDTAVANWRKLCGCSQCLSDLKQRESKQREFDEKEESAAAENAAHEAERTKEERRRELEKRRQSALALYAEGKLEACLEALVDIPCDDAEVLELRKKCKDKLNEQAARIALMNDIKNAHAAFAKKDFKTGFDIAVKLGLAKISDSYVTYHVGYCYSPTYGTEYPNDKDYAKAYEWFCKTAKLEESVENGDGITECILGDMELAGRGCASNLENAVKWYKRSAVRGYWRGRCELGRCYERNLVGDGEDHLIEATNYYFQAMLSGGDSEATNAYQRVKEELNEKFTKDALLAFVEDRWPQGVELAMKTDLRDRRLRVLVGLCCFSGIGIEKNPTIAVRHIRAAADMGEPMAQTLLASCYMYGNVPKNCKGLPVDLAEAIQWLQKAAAQGEPLAQCTLGLCYEEGKGVSADQDVAVSWFRKAAEQGLPSAQTALGVRYVAGLGLPKNEKQGVKWIQKAVDQGWAHAMRELANCYTRGLGVPKNLELAEYWRKEAKKGKAGEDFTQEWIARWHKGIGAQKTACGCAHADKSSMKRAMELLEDGERYYWGRGVVQDDGRAMKCWRESADLGLPLAYCKLATMYRDGRGCKQNAESAVALFRKAADAGVPNARYWLGLALRDGYGCEKNQTLADQLLRQAVLEFREKAERGDAEAQWSLGVALSYGIGCEKNELEALKWYRSASENGNLVAQDQIGYLTEHGEQGVPKDEKRAVSIYREAAEKGCAGAQYHLALAYLKGKGVEKNGELAFSWCKKAADAGLCEAQNKVGDMLSEGVGCEKDEKAAVKWWIKAARQDGCSISGAAMFKLDMKGVKWADDEIPNADKK